MEINQETNLKIETYLSLCIDLEKEPSEEKERAITEFLSKLIVKEYMGLREKTVAGISILADINENYDAAGAAAAIEMGKLKYGLLKYAINLDTELGILDKTYTVYDMCMKYGLAKTLLQSCEKDYVRFCAYVDSMVSASNIYFLIQTASLLNSDELGKWVETMKEVKDTLTPEVLKSIEAISINNSTTVSEFIKGLAEESLENANNMIANDEEKYRQISEDLARPENELNKES